MKEPDELARGLIRHLVYRLTIFWFSIRFLAVQDAVIVVTGATDGIGAATARLLASQGARVIGIGRSAEKAAALRASTQGAVEVLTADFSSMVCARDTGRALAARLDRVDLLVHCVGVLTPRAGMAAHGQAQLANDVFAAELRRRTSVVTVGYGPGSAETSIRRALPSWLETVMRPVFKTRRADEVAEDLRAIATSAEVTRRPAQALYYDRGVAFEPEPFVTAPSQGQALFDTSEAILAPLLLGR